MVDNGRRFVLQLKNGEKERNVIIEGWVLVVDDDTSNLTMANRILSSEGLRVSCMKSGEAAIRFL